MLCLAALLACGNIDRIVASRLPLFQCPATTCFELGEFYSDVGDATTGIDQNGLTVEDEYWVDHTCSQIASVVAAGWPDETYQHNDPTDADAYGTIGGAGISFFTDFLEIASVADITYMFIHEGRHNLGQDHSGTDFGGDDSDVAWDYCGNMVLKGSVM